MRSYTAVLLCLCLSVALCSAAVNFGHATRSLFALEDGYYNFNHGSFGSVPKQVLSVQQDFIATMESRPDPWFRGGYQAELQIVRSKLADYLSGDKEDIVLIENASSGVNSVLRSLASTLLREKAVLYLSTAYSMVPNTLHYLASHELITLIQANVTFPLKNAGQDIVSLVAQTLKQSATPQVKLCIFSHVTSVPSIVLPIEQLASECHAAGALVLIDGAHAPGQVAINLTQFAASGVDYYIGNAHKWLFSPKGSAFLWTAPAVQNTVVPTVVSSSGKLDYQGEYEYTGTRDYTAFCSVGAALDFRASFGDAAIRSYVTNLAVWAGHHLATLWNTETLVDDSMVGSMVNVRLPVTDAGVAAALSQRLLDDYNMYVVVYPLQGAYWTRLSAQIYLEQSDFDLLGQVVLQLTKQGLSLSGVTEHGQVASPHVLRVAL